MIKFTFGENLLNGLRPLLTDEGIEKAIESALEHYNWYTEKYGKAPNGFYCSFTGMNRSTSRKALPTMMPSSSMK